jgi:Sec-independent protein translocase protein TatA
MKRRYDGIFKVKGKGDMDFLGIGVPEILFVLIIAILVIGPKDITKTARTIGRFLNRLYKSDEWRALIEASRTLRTLPNRLAREAELEELDTIKETLKETSRDLDRVQRDVAQETKATTSALSQEGDGAAEAMKAWTTPPEKREGSIPQLDDPEEDRISAGGEES